MDQQDLDTPAGIVGRRYRGLRIAAVVLLYYLLLTVAMAGAALLLAGCGTTVTLRTEQVPTASRVQWEEDVTDRINKLDIRLKKFEQKKKEEPDA